MKHNYYFVSHTPINGGKFVLNKRAEVDSNWKRERLYQDLGHIREAAFMPQQTFDATSIGS